MSATFSWQKALGGEAAHGMLVLCPRAVERLEQEPAPRPLPKIFRLTKGGKLIEGIFRGETINTPSMLCVEDWLLALEWAERIGRAEGADRAGRRERCGARSLGAGVPDWIEHLATDPAIRSNTSVCLQFAERSDVEANKARQKAIGQAARAGGCGVRHRRLSRCSAGPAHLVRRDGRDRGHRGARTVARLGVGGDGVNAVVKVLIADKMDPKAAAIFRERGIEVDEKPGLTPDELERDHRRL